MQILRIRQRGTLFRGHDASTQSAAFPAICVLPSGRWLCSFRVAPEKVNCVGERVFLSWSDDEGATWTPAQAPFTPPVFNGKPGNYRIGLCTPLGADNVAAVLAWVDQSRPERPFFDAETNSLLDMKMVIARSCDGGATWTGSTFIPSIPSDASTPLTGPILLLGDGSWICQYETNKPYDVKGDWVHTSRLLFSRDKGKSWGDPVIITDSKKGIFLWDQRPSLRPDGSLQNVFWTYDNRKSTYLNIHASRSQDGGHSWSKPSDTGVPGQPAAIVSLDDGCDVLVFVERDTVPALKARLSTDGGVTWPAESEILLASAQSCNTTLSKDGMGDAWEEMGAFSMGLPATAQCQNGDLLVVYYCGENSDQTSIEWIRLGF